MTGGGSSDTIDPHTATTQPDWARVNSLYDPLVYMKPNAQFELWLAEEITSNSDATEWTIRVRPGVTFHNGKSLDADDVIFTLRRILNPKAPLEGAALLTAIDTAALTKVDSRTVRVPCKTPFSTLNQVLGLWLYDVVPVDYDPKHPVGTGPFVFKSFTPGQQSISPGIRTTGATRIHLSTNSSSMSSRTRRVRSTHSFPIRRTFSITFHPLRSTRSAVRPRRCSYRPVEGIHHSLCGWTWLP